MRRTAHFDERHRAMLTETETIRRNQPHQK